MISLFQFFDPAIPYTDTIGLIIIFFWFERRSRQYDARLRVVENQISRLVGFEEGKEVKR